MPSSTSTFTTLRALHLVIADALDDMQRVFSQYSIRDPTASPGSQSSSPVYPSSPVFSPAVSPFPATPPTSVPPTPLSATFPSPPHTDPGVGVPFVDYPSPDLPFVSGSLSEQLALHPDAVAAAIKIVAACGQISNIVHKPFLSLCDAIMSYNLPACMRLVEHLHVAEILREANENRKRCPATGQSYFDIKLDQKIEVNGPVSDTMTSEYRTSVKLDSSRVHRSTEGLHVADIVDVICSYAGASYVDTSDLVHALRLLSTHHIFRETAPDTFALNRVASLLDSGKSVETVFSDPEAKYDDTGGMPAFVALITDELFKSAAYLTEAFTGVQLPTPESALPGAIIPSVSGHVANDPIRCPLARSSSILTHIMYPDDEDVHTSSLSLPATGAPENGGPHPPSASDLLLSQPTVIEPHLHSSPAEPSTQFGEHARFGDAAKPEKLLAFNLAFHTHAPYFEWLENGGEDPLGGTGEGASVRTQNTLIREPRVVDEKPHRLQRFSNAMKGSIAWEAPKAILRFDWHSLTKGSTIVDVGGGIGSTTMVLARALNDPGFDFAKKQDSLLNEEEFQSASAADFRRRSRLPNDPALAPRDGPQSIGTPKNEFNFRFVVQDRPVVTALGIDAWRSKCPEMLESGQVAFKNQDFFEPQSPLEPPHITDFPSVYLLRVVLHDWPDEAARRILINLRVASNPETRLIIAEHVLPLACMDEDLVHARNQGDSKEQWTLSSVLANIEGAERTLVAPPLLSNLGKASANAYWMDLIMHITLNGKERTLREFCALTLSAGWRITRMTRPDGHLFAYLVCEPIRIPDDAHAIYNAVVLSSELANVVDVPTNDPVHQSLLDPSRNKLLPPRPMSLLPSPFLKRSTSRCGTPTFGSRVLLPKDEELQSSRFRPKKWFKSKGLGVRSVMMQKVEKQREGQTPVTGAVTRDDGGAQGVVPQPSSSHVRVWWRKTPPNSTSNSTTAIHELNGEVAEQRTTGRRRRSTLKSSDIPSTPSPRVSPVHQNWPSTESASVVASGFWPHASRARRPSVASITRKLSFASFGRRPSIPDITEPLPTPPPSAALVDLAPPPILRGDTGRNIRHLPSLPTFRRNEVATGTKGAQPVIPRRPSLSFTVETPAPKPGPDIDQNLPLRPDVTGSPQSGILGSRAHLHTKKQSPPEAAESMTTPRRQRRVTLSNSVSPKTLAQSSGTGSMGGPFDTVGLVPEVRRVPSMPRLPRRLSIPMLLRKRNQSAVRDIQTTS